MVNNSGVSPWFDPLNLQSCRETLSFMIKGKFPLLNLRVSSIQHLDPKIPSSIRKVYQDKVLTKVLIDKVLVKVGECTTNEYIKYNDSKKGESQT